MSHPMVARRSLAPSRLEAILAVLTIFAVGFMARLWPTVQGSGLFGLHFYDDAVHYGAAVGLVNGRMPYRDFLLLHPPGIVVALAPFAELGQWIGDARGFAVARLSFIILGAVNALLVWRFLRPVGLFASWLGGLTYALFWPAIYSEHTVLLEGPANTCLLIALILVVPVLSHRAPTRAGLVVAGALLGFALSIKIWGVVPIFLIFGWLIYRFGLRRTWPFLVSAAAATTAVCLPFFVTAPGTMWQMVVLDQVQRNDTGFRVFERLNEIAGLTLYRPPDRLTVLLVVASAGLVAATVAALWHRRARLPVILLVGLFVMLLLTPSWFVHYTALTAPLVAIVIGVGGHQLLQVPAVRRLRPLRLGLAAALVLALAGASAPIASAKIGQSFPGRTLGNAVADRPGCVTADHPGPLILMNVLSRNLDRGCPLVVDLGGASYHLPSPQRGVTTRRKNVVFQEYALAYLRTGDTTILARFRKNYGLSARSFNTVQSWPVVAKAGRYTVHEPR
jgi:alpha-1,2-mannosyltransferase